MATPITDHVQQAVDRLLYQYRDKPRFVALITALVTPEQEIEDVLDDLNTQTMLANATGVTLDNIGTIVGLERTPGDSDDVYRRKIFAEIKVNTSDGNPEDAIQTFQLMTDAGLVLLDEYPPAQVLIESDYQFQGQDDVDQLIGFVEKVLPAGVRCNGFVQFDPDNAFAFAGALPGLGWSPSRAKVTYQGLVFTAKEYGTGGNAVTVLITMTGFTGTPVATVVGSAITVTANEATTGQDVKDAIAANPAADALVTVDGYLAGLMFDGFNSLGACYSSVDNTGFPGFEVCDALFSETPVPLTGGTGSPSSGGLWADIKRRGTTFGFAGDNAGLAGLGSDEDPLVGGRWAVPNVAPYFFSASVPESGAEVVVQLVAAGLPPLLPRTSGLTGFTVRVNSVVRPITSAGIEYNTKAFLTLASTVFPGDTVTVEYAPGNVVDSQGLALAAFAAQPVTNGSTTTP